jgi:hypothetical protein
MSITIEDFLVAFESDDISQTSDGQPVSSGESREPGAIHFYVFLGRGE